MCVGGDEKEGRDHRPHRASEATRNDSGSVFCLRLVADPSEARRMAQHFAGY